MIKSSSVKNAWRSILNGAVTSLEEGRKENELSFRQLQRLAAILDVEIKVFITERRPRSVKVASVSKKEK